MIIRRERRGDANAIFDVHARAFGRAVEAKLADDLRASDAWVPQLSLVALADAEIVGHVVCSRGRLEPDGHAVLGLGPIGVDPDRQRDGIGSALMHAVLGAADALGEPIVALLGDPAYYNRFGFAPARTYDIEPTDETWGDFFQVRTLASYRPELHGTFHYAAPFATIEE
jgi:putative acetyltransferase